MRLHEEFGISVSDDTVYRALKELGFSHVSARPKAYKQVSSGEACTMPAQQRVRRGRSNTLGYRTGTNDRAGRRKTIAALRPDAAVRLAPQHDKAVVSTQLLGFKGGSWT
jgi:Winged helix-turn helix